MPYLSEAPEIFFQRLYTGWITLRNQLTTPIRLMGRRVIELYDALITGNDLEITPVLSLKRRPGYLSYASAVMNGTLLNLYSWRSASLGVYQIFDTTVDIEYIAPGAASPTVLFTKPAGAAGNKAYFFGVGNYLFVSGVGYAFKWDSGAPQGVTNWGITIGSATLGPYGPAGISGKNVVIGGGVAWVNPANVASTVAFATATIPHGTALSYWLNAYNFSAVVPPSSVIAGVQVNFNLSLTSAGTALGTANVRLAINGVPTGLLRFVNITPGIGVVNVTLGGQTDTWGAALTAAILNNANFGFDIDCQGLGAAGNAVYSVNDCQLTIFTGPLPVATPTGVGTFTAINGFSYVQAYGNSSSGEISNGGPVSLNTGPFSNKASVQVSVTASTDAQVDTIHVFRTTDSGGGSIFYELPNSPFPNTTGNITDTALDTALQINSQAAVNLENTPPPMNLTAMEWFAGRLWGAVGNLLYFSTGPDTFIGLEQSNWNPEYVFTLPTAISRMIATPNGMLVMCVDDCYIVRGTATVTFTVNEFVRDLACRNYNAADSDGSNIYVFTSDRQLLQIGGNGMADIGQSIGDQLLNVDPTQAYVSIYRYGLDSMMFVLDVANGVLYPYNVPQQCWCLPAILKFSSAPTAAGAIEISPGVWKYIIGAGTGLGQRDLATFADLGNAYSPVAVIGAITLADPLSLAKVENVVMQLTSAGNVPSLSILPNDAGVTLSLSVGNQVTGNFTSLSVGNNPLQEPPTYASQAVNFRNLRYQWSLSTLPAQIQFFQALLQWGNEQAGNELIGFGISGKQQGDSPQPGQIPQLQGH